MTAAPAYPPAERLDLVDHLHGRRVADPYRWLEDPDDPRTRTWSAAQDALARTHLDALPGRDPLAATLGALTAAGWVEVPIWRAGRRFATRREPGQEHGVLYVADPVGTDLAGTERVLIDPAALDPTGTTTLDAWTPDHAGRLLVYQLSSGGDEQSVLHVLDVATGEDVEPPIDRCRYSDVAWLPGGEEFLYVRMVTPDQAPPGEQAFHRRIWRHRVGTPTDADVLIDGPGLYCQDANSAAAAFGEHTYYGVDVSDDGRWLLVTANVGTARRDSVWIADLHGSARRPGPRAHPGRRRALPSLGRARRPALPADHRRRSPLPPRRRRPGHAGPRALARAGGRGPRLGARRCRMAAARRLGRPGGRPARARPQPSRRRGGGAARPRRDAARRRPACPASARCAA